MEKIDNRIARIATSEATKANGVVTNISVAMHIDRVLPIIAFNDALPTKHNIKSTPTPALPASGVLNTLSDDSSGTERFTYMGYGTSVITNSDVRIYYDALYKDVIVLPSTELLIVDEGLQNGKTYTIKGYALGSTNNTVSNDMFNTIDSKRVEDDSVLPAMNPNLPNIVSHVLSLPGVGYDNNSNGHMLGRMITGETYLERNGTDKSMLLELGTVSEVLADVNEAIPCYTVMQYTPKYNTAKYCGIKKLTPTLKLGYFLDF